MLSTVVITVLTDPYASHRPNAHSDYEIFLYYGLSPLIYKIKNRQVNYPYRVDTCRQSFRFKPDSMLRQFNYARML